MADREYVIFTLRETRYAIESSDVREIVSLPELMPIAEAPDYVAGIVNVRGTIVPVIDLAVRIGAAPRPYRVTDTVILFRNAGESFGIIVDGVHEVRAIGADAIEPVPSYGAPSSGSHRFIAGVVKGDEGMIALLSLDALLRSAGEIDIAASPDAPALLPERSRDLPAFPAAERSIFHRRAESLMQATEGDDAAGLFSMALFRLGEEYFAAKLELIREFTDIVDPTPVPCSPPHIVGQMNLRGDILTLVDIRPALRMPLAELSALSKVIVLDIADLRAGIIADEVIDVIALPPSAVAPLPAAVGSPVDEYITGVAHHGERTIGILDLAAIFARGELNVEEEVG